MNVMRTLIVSGLLIMMTACGGFRKEATGIEESTSIVLMAPDLVGASVSTDGFKIKITDADLRDYDIGILGVKDSPEERMDAFVIPLSQGTHSLSVTLPTGQVVTKDFYLATGQMRKWVIK